MRLIDAEKLAEVLNRYLAAPHVQLRNSGISVGLRMGINTCLTFLNNAKTIEAEPVRHGRWIDAYPDIEPNPMFMYGICSECGFEQGISKYLSYCPNCGAKMDELLNCG